MNCKNLYVQSEKNSINFKGLDLVTNLKCDLLVENSICIELKAVKEILAVHEAQLLSYMKLLKIPKGILYNFNVYNLYNEGQ